MAELEAALLVISPRALRDVDDNGAFVAVLFLVLAEMFSAVASVVAVVVVVVLGILFVCLLFTLTNNKSLIHEIYQSVVNTSDSFDDRNRKEREKLKFLSRGNF